MRRRSKGSFKGLGLKSTQHVACLEKAGHFPKRVQLDPNGVGWVAAEVLNWLQVRLADQDNPTGVPGRELGQHHARSHCGHDLRRPFFSGRAADGPLARDSRSLHSPSSRLAGF
jgi:prophage regulatory protein